MVLVVSQNDCKCDSGRLFTQVSLNVAWMDGYEPELSLVGWLLYRICASFNCPYLIVELKGSGLMLLNLMSVLGAKLSYFSEVRLMARTLLELHILTVERRSSITILCGPFS